LIDPPSLVSSIVTVVEDDMSVVGIRVSVDIKALSSKVLDVSVSSTNPLGSLSVVSSVLSDGSGNVDSETVSSLVGNNVASSSVGSDGSGSGIEDPPLLVVLWTVVSDSQSELVASDMLVPEECSSAWHSSLDLELNSISDWVSWVLSSSNVIVPSLVDTVVASVENGPSSVDVSVSVNIKTVVGHHSNVLVGSLEPSDLLSWLVSPYSSVSVSWLMSKISILVGDS